MPDWLVRVMLKMGAREVVARGHTLRDEGRSPGWTKLRNQFVKANPFCIVCHVRDDLDVHHRVPFHVDRTLELVWDNLRTMCRKCHWVWGHFADPHWLLYNLNLDQQVEQFHQNAIIAPRSV